VSGSEQPTEQNPVILGRVAEAALSPRPVWSSGAAYIITAIAGVVGLGAIWRFPYLVGEHGGGAFLVAYVICIAAIALPLAAIESSAGRMVRRSPVGLFHSIVGPAGRPFGWLVIGVTVALMSYYFVVSGWTLGYALESYTGRVRTFPEFTGGYASLWLLAAIGVLVYLVLLRGTGAIEAASRLLLPLLGVIVLALTVYALTLDGAGEAMSFYLGVDLSHLGDAATWRAAAGQAFYQMGIGQGFLIVYGSYAPSGLNLARATGIIATANASVAIIAGLMIFPIVFTYGIAPDAGTQLAFTALPQVLSDIALGWLVGIAFFTLLFIAAFTSCIGGSTVAISAVRDEARVGPRRAALIVVTLIVVLGIPSGLSFTPVGLELGGRPFLDAIDDLTGSGIIIAVGLIGSALIAWQVPTWRLARALHAGRRRVGPVVLHGWWIIYFVRALPLAGIAIIALGILF
jgi:neurotransmitter:Na+ symporter, NSS family